MVNGSNGESTHLVVIPQIVEEPKMALVPQPQTQPVARNFSDQTSFISAPWYDWQFQGVVGADDKAS